MLSTANGQNNLRELKRSLDAAKTDVVYMREVELEDEEKDRHGSRAFVVDSGGRRVYRSRYVSYPWGRASGTDRPVLRAMCFGYAELEAERKGRSTYSCGGALPT